MSSTISASAIHTNKKKIKLVVSDFHIGSGLYLRDGTRNILEDFQYDDAFISFLNYYSSGEYHDCAVELIINGDFLNLLQINYRGVFTHLITERMVIEAIRQSFVGHRDLFDSLKRFGKTPHHTITYIMGNHDQGMLFSGARELFSSNLEHDVKYFDSYYEFDGVHVEHGHMHEWNSRMHDNIYFLSKGLPEAVLNLPWGSRFVSEFLYKLKIERPFLDKVKPFNFMVRWMIFNDTIFAFKTLFRVIWYFFTTLIFDDLRKRFSFSGTWNLLRSITIYPSFDREAKKHLLSNPQIQTLIMGHTHVLRYRRYSEGKEYYNTGTWNEATELSLSTLGTHVLLTYAIIEYPELPEDLDPDTIRDKASFRPRVKLKEWKGMWRPEVDAAIG